MTPPPAKGFIRAMLSSDSAVSFGRVAAFTLLIAYIPGYVYTVFTWRWDAMTLVYYNCVQVLFFLAALMPSKITDAMRAIFSRGAETAKPTTEERP